jgi:hypothetical protein
MKFTHATRHAVDEATDKEKAYTINAYRATNGPLALGVTLRSEEGDPGAVATLCQKIKELVREFENPNQLDMMPDQPEGPLEVSAGNIPDRVAR